MARRIYNKNSRSEKIKNKTLEQIRELRGNLDPNILSKLGDVMSNHKTTDISMELRVDKKKNVDTVMQALTLRDNPSAKFLHEIQEIVKKER